MHTRCPQSGPIYARPPLKRSRMDVGYLRVSALQQSYIYVGHIPHAHEILTEKTVHTYTGPSETIQMHVGQPSFLAYSYHIYISQQYMIYRMPMECLQSSPYIPTRAPLKPSHIHVGYPRILVYSNHIYISQQYMGYTRSIGYAHRATRTSTRSSVAKSNAHRLPYIQTYSNYIYIYISAVYVIYRTITYTESIGYAHKANRTYTRSSAAISNAPRLIEVTKEKDIKMNIK